MIELDSDCLTLMKSIFLLIKLFSFVLLGSKVLFKYGLVRVVKLRFLKRARALVFVFLRVKKSFFVGEMSVGCSVR